MRCELRQLIGSSVLLLMTSSAAAIDANGKDAAEGKAAERIQELQSLGAQATRLRDEGKLAEAIAVTERIVTAGREITDPAAKETLAAWLSFLAEMREAREDFGTARKARQESLDLLTKQFGAAHWRTVDARLALEHLDRLARLSPDERRELAQAEECEREASELDEARKSREAVRSAERCAAIRKRILGEAHPDYARILNMLGRMFDDQGDYARAEPLYRQALEIKKNALGASHPDYATGLNILALFYADHGDHARAEPLYRQALEIKKKALGAGDPACAATLNNLAMLFEAQGDYARAEPLLLQTVEIAGKALGPDDPHYATSLNNLGSLYWKQGDYARAEPLLRQALEIRRKAPGETHPDYATSLNNLAALYEDQGDYARAEPLLRQALEIVKRALGKEHPYYAGSLNNLARLYVMQGDFARGERLFRQAVEIHKKRLGDGHPDYAASLNNLAWMYAAQCDYARAEPLFRQALQIRERVFGKSHPSCAETLNNLANLYGNQGDYARAEPLLRQVLEMARKTLGEGHPDYAIALGNVGGLYRDQGDYARAEPLLRQAAIVARRNLERTATVQSQRQQLAMLQSVRYHLDNYVALVAAGAPAVEAAYRETLAWKGIVLRTQRQLRAESQQPELAPVFRKLQHTTQQYARVAWATPGPGQEAGWRQRVEELAAEKEQIEAELMARSAAYRQASRQVTLEEVQSALPQEAVVVDFLEYNGSTPRVKKSGVKECWERRLVAFIVAPGRPVALVPLGAADSVGEAIEAWRVAFGTSPQGAAAGQRLREQVWLPIEAQLGGAKILLLSPDGVLGRLPLAALPGRRPGTYILEERTIALMPVARLIPEIVQETPHKRPRKNLILLGDVDYDAEPRESLPNSPSPLDVSRSYGLSRGALAGPRKFPDLPGTRAEIAAIEALHRESVGDNEERKALTRAEASRQAVLAEAGRFAYLHIATHGFFLEEENVICTSPLRGGHMMGQVRPGDEAGRMHPGLLSGLVLAGANRGARPSSPALLPAATEGWSGKGNDTPDNGLLTAEEIGAQNMEGVELVVLSACETGLGKAAGGEGLLGLQRAFQSAGARTVVASLWKVNDQGTQALMVEFYKNIWEKKLSKLDALRQAQLKLLREYDPKKGRLRGAAPSRMSIWQRSRSAKEASRPGERVSPFYWAAFVLSGDWR